MVTVKEPKVEIDTLQITRPPHKNGGKKPVLLLTPSRPLAPLFLFGQEGRGFSKTAKS